MNKVFAILVSDSDDDDNIDPQMDENDGDESDDWIDVLIGGMNLIERNNQTIASLTHSSPKTFLIIL